KSFCHLVVRTIRLLTAREPHLLRRVVRYWARLERHWQIAGAVALATMLLVALSFAPIVRAVASSKAAARGLELEITGFVRPGLHSVHLGDATLNLEGTPVVHARFDHVEVRMTPWLSLRGVSVDGGEVRLAGSASEVREAIDAWRARRRSGSESGGGGVRSSLP